MAKGVELYNLVEDISESRNLAAAEPGKVEELDASVGRVLKALRDAGVERDTLVLFTSDNGPFLSYGARAGSAGPLREGKLTAFEGGVREPLIARWPGTIPAGRNSDAFITALDILPTLARLISAKLPAAKIDGQNLSDLLLGKPGAKGRDTFFYYSGEELQTVRLGRWKLHAHHDYLTVAGAPGMGGKPANFANMKPNAIEESGIRGIASRHGYEVKQIEQSLFDLETDPGETHDLASANPAIVSRLLGLAAEARQDLGDSITGAMGKNVRPAGGAK